MNVNLHLTGDLENFIKSLIEKGLAANKTEAIRLAIVRYYEEYNTVENTRLENAFNQASVESAWNNSRDDKAEKFYRKTKKR